MSLESDYFMEPVGADLKSIREKRKITLAQIAQTTRISLNYLNSLELGRYSELPGGIYNRAFLRLYCEYLGLDPKDYLERYEGEIAQPNDRTAKSKSKLPSQPRMDFTPHPILAWGIMLIFSVVGLYFSRHWISKVFSPYFSHSPVASMPPQQPAPQAPTQQAVGVIPGAPQSNQVVSAQIPQSRSEPSSPPVSSEVKQAGTTDIGKGIKAPPPPPMPGTMRIEFHVLEKCWVSVDSDGTRVLVKLLEPGEDQYFDATERFYVVLGNAGGVRLKINGKPAKRLGKPGEVVKFLINQQNMSELLERSSG